jgi:nucleotide-binding universal stress UspA family protein
MNEKILVPVDGSEYSIRALDAAADLASTLHATLVICEVVDVNRAATMSFGEPQLVQGCIDALRVECEAGVKQAVERVTPRVAGVESRVATGNVVEEILKLATETGAKWIVMGSHGRTGLNRLLMGSVAEGVLRHAPVPVMIVPPQRHGHHHATAATAAPSSS